MQRGVKNKAILKPRKTKRRKAQAKADSPDERAAAILVQLEALRERVTRMDQNCETLNKILTGNGDPSKGLIIRLDRLEILQVRRTQFFGAAVVASISAWVAAVAAWVKG